MLPDNPHPKPSPLHGGGSRRGSRFAALLDQLTLPEIPRRTLSIGCGAFTEYALLHQRWRGWLHLGIDWDREALRTAPQETVIVADAQQLPFACDFGLILIRHPDVIKCPHNWTAIIQQAPRFLAHEGVLLITTYSLQEWDFVQRIIKLQTIDTANLPPIDLVGRDKFCGIQMKNL